MIYRNTIGSPVADLRSGPADPPLGSGSLSILVDSGAEKVAYGVSMRGQLKALTEVGFRVYTTSENVEAGHPATANMPGITFEMDPNIDAINASYTSLVWLPPQGKPDGWSPYLDGTKEGLWGFTGSAFNSPATKANCGINGPRCTLAEVMALLGDDGTPAGAHHVRDHQGPRLRVPGAVDDLRLNGRTADFEEGGVVVKAS